MGESSRAPETKFFLAAPQGYVVAAYIVIQALLVVIGVIFPAQAPIVIIVSLVALAATIAIVLMLRKSVRYIESKDDKVETVTDWRKSVLIAIENIKPDAQCNNNLISSLVDEIKFSDPVSNESTAPIEADILEKIKSFSKCSDIERQIEDIRKLVQKRNSICKLSK